VLRDGQFVNRFLTFYYFNATAFNSRRRWCLLLNERFYTSEPKVAALTLTTVVDLISLVGALHPQHARLLHLATYVHHRADMLPLCLLRKVRFIFDRSILSSQARFLHVKWFIYQVWFFFVPSCAVHINEGSCASSCCSGWRRKGCLPVTGRIKNRVLRAKKREE
jgi:hypothetical protein